MMSLAARERRRARWLHTPVPQPAPQAEPVRMLSRLAQRFIRATGWRLHGLRS